jgi:hypothetical protein
MPNPMSAAGLKMAETRVWEILDDAAAAEKRLNKARVDSGKPPAPKIFFTADEVAQIKAEHATELAKLRAEIKPAEERSPWEKGGTEWLAWHYDGFCESFSLPRFARADAGDGRRATAATEYFPDSLAAQANRDFLRVRAEVEDALRLWRDRGRPTDRLIHAGVPLAEAEDLVRRFAAELPEELVEFARLSGNRARRRQNVVAAAAVVFAIVAVAAIAASIVAYRAKQEAVAQRDRAERATQAMKMVVGTTSNATSELYLQFFLRHVSIDLWGLVAEPLIQGYRQALQSDPSNAVAQESPHFRGTRKSLNLGFPRRL